MNNIENIITIGAKIFKGSIEGCLKMEEQKGNTSIKISDMYMYIDLISQHFLPSIEINLNNLAILSAINDSIIKTE